MTTTRRDEGGLAQELPGLEGWPAPHAARASEDGQYVDYDWITSDFSDWTTADFSKERRRIEPGPRILTEFVNLFDASPDQIAAHAARWGHLGLDEHGRPGQWGDVNRERVRDWHRWATEARALLNFGNAIARGIAAADEDRDILKKAARTLPWPINRKTGESWADSRNLAFHVNRWIALGQVKPEFRWGEHDETPTYVIQSPGLFGALALSIAGALSNTSSVATCMSCGQPYFPERKPQRGLRNYCPPCRGPSGKQASWRDSKRRERERKRAETA